MEEAVIEVVLVTAEEAEVDLVAVTDVDGAVQEAGTDDPGPVVEIEDDHAGKSQQHSISLRNLYWQFLNFFSLSYCM